ncbi:unnamed protein product [Heligmosomoides polygyrus]|uniref:Serine/threonine-protein phosphatase PGAM5, mitochondrial n=1 Tax=Heligmosomoides polygyrus TaxID=6339 RepID=A0A183F5B1_HELPZ|nr:unnamed protein product [Heligmosomoides polygyrus]
MVLLRNVVKVAACVSGCALASKLVDDGTLRKAHALTTAERRTFEEHFPRGSWDDNWDFRSPQFLIDGTKYAQASEADKKKMDEEVKAKATRNIILIRHGQYFLDTDKKNLTPLGREQAALLGKRLAESGMKFDSLVMSTMTRATETAEIILELFPNLKRTSCSLIEEGPPYPPVPAVDHWKPPLAVGVLLRRREDRVRLPSTYTPRTTVSKGGLLRRHIHRAPPSQKEDSYEIIVCHANVIRYFVCRALQFPPEGWLRMSLGNCSITWLVVRPSGRVSLRSLGDIGHLPPSKVSFT